MAGDFERAVIRELDQIRQSFERACARLEERDESRDGEVSDLKLQVGLLRGECRRNVKRDAALVSAPTVLVTAVVAIAQHLAPAPAAPPPPPPPPAIAVPSHGAP